MAEPSEKSPEMEAFLDMTSEEVCGIKRTDAIKQDICVACKGPATGFEDGLSRKEYTISGLCQNCQNKTFVEPEEDEVEDTDELDPDDFIGGYEDDGPAF